VDFQLKQQATAFGNGVLDVGTLRRLLTAPDTSKIPDAAKIRITQIDEQRDTSWKVEVSW
jgi:hypothetical protein